MHSNTETPRPSFSSQLRSVKENQQDFEWYPTTDEIITAFTRDLTQDLEENYRRSASILDIGAGNGKVLNAAGAVPETGTLYAIEKSSVLLNLLPASVFVLGVDFWKTSLIDKQLDIIFCNPPYSEFIEWSSKIIREAPPNTLIYLVIPARWENSEILRLDCLQRDCKTEIIGNFDFEDAEDRQARAKVHLLKIKMQDSRRSQKDPFTQFFDQTFHYPEPTEEKHSFQEKIEETQLVNRANFIEALCLLYDMRIQELQENYLNVCKLPHSLLQEFEISKDSLIKSLQMKLATTKKEYWQRLFDGMEEIKSRLTKNSRNNIMNLMQAQTGIDFNKENAYAVVLWVIKNANTYFDEQLITTYERMIEFANIEGYKSNKRIFQEDRFRYQFVQDENNRDYRLKVGHRMVLSRCGGLRKSNYSSDRIGLCGSAADFLSDLITVAGNLGFTVIEHSPQEYEWNDSAAHIYQFKTTNGKNEVLFRVKAYQNSNLHMQFHPEFINALNIQHGKLKGWLRNDEQAAEELEIPIEQVNKHFNDGYKLTHTSLRLCAGSNDQSDAA